MFCAPGLIFGGTEGVGSRFNYLRSRTRFRRNRGRRVPISCFTLPDSFSAVPRAAGPVFMFCAPGLIFGGTEGVGSRFHVLFARTHFRRYRWRRVLFSCFALPNSFSAVPSASVPIFMFCAPGLIIGGTEGVGSCFHVLRSRTPFRWYQGRRAPFSCFARQDSFSTIPRASGPVFIVLRSRTRFRRYRGRRVSFSYSTLPDSFTAVSRAFDPVFMFFAPGHIFRCAEGVGSCFHVWRARTHFRRYRGRRVLFSCFAQPDSFSAVPRAWGPVFMFYAPGLVFSGTEGVRSRFLVFRSRTLFRRYRGRQVPFSSFRRYRGRRVPFSYFARPYSFSAVLRASVPVFMFCAPGLFFGGTEGVRSRFHVFRSQTCF
jgi:hypothetical protein